MDILNRERAPFGADIWAAIDREVKEVLTGRMVGRRAVDVEAPRGLGFSALGTGAMAPLEPKKKEHSVMIRQNLPVAEFRFPFQISKDDVDKMARGADGPEHPDSLRDAAINLAETEDGMIFNGLPGAGITGILEHASKCPGASKAEALPKTVVTLIETMQQQKVEGPFALLLGNELYAELFASPGYPLSMKLEQILGNGGKIILAPLLEKRYALISLRGGDFRLVPGMDAGVGYSGETKEHYELFVFESCTFQVITPEACALSQK